MLEKNTSKREEINMKHQHLQKSLILHVTGSCHPDPVARSLVFELNLTRVDTFFLDDFHVENHEQVFHHDPNM